MFKTTYQKRRNQHIYTENRGKKCLTIGCDSNARVKLLCLLCYQKKNRKIKEV